MNKSQLLVENWNLKYPVGTPVLYQRVKGGQRYPSKTESAAYISDSGTPVIFLECVSGYYALSHVTPDNVLQPTQEGAAEKQSFGVTLMED